MHMKRFLPAILPVLMAACLHHYTTKSYTGKPWQIQNIPGKIECELYDKGGEAVAYHDTDSINNGSGKLNPANGNFLNEFRMNEGVDISYTKPGGIDNSPFNRSQPMMNQFYVGWTQPGEWINYTIKVNETASYRIAIMYTANGNGAIALDIDNRQVAAPLKIFSTHNDADTVAWRQWHHWDKLDSLTSIHIAKGFHILTLHVIDHGNMNFDYLEFTKQ
jgi:Carbohydrate binding module (family 6)